METRKIEVYSYEELTEDAKEKAREWWREGGLDYEWWDYVYDDAKQVGALMGIDISNIYFSGFSSQGDGACFEGSYHYQKESVKQVKAYAPKDKELHSITLGLSKLQRKHFYGLTAHVKHSGHYSHERCTEIRVYGREGDYLDADIEESLAELLRDFMCWIYKRLEAEYDYLNSDEAVSETIQANEYQFTEDGKRSVYL